MTNFLIVGVVVLLLSIQTMKANESHHKCCTDKTERTVRLKHEVDKYQLKYNDARQYLVKLHQECQILSTMVAYLQTVESNGNRKLCFEFKEFIKSFNITRTKIIKTINDLRNACRSLQDILKALANRNSCKYGRCLQGCEADRNVLECKVKKFVDDSEQLFGIANVLIIGVQKTCGILGEQADNFCVKNLDCNKCKANNSKQLSQILTFLAEFDTNIAPGHESLHDLAEICEEVQNNINDLLAYNMILSNCSSTSNCL